MLLYCFAHSADIWWKGIETKLSRLDRLQVWRVPTDQSKELAKLAQRSMQLQVTVQEGQIWVGNASHSVAVEPRLLKAQQPRR